MGEPRGFKKLTKNDCDFLRYIAKGMPAKYAYLKIHPDVTPESANTLAYRKRAKLKKKIDWQRLLEASDLGEERLLREIERRLNARITKYFKDISLGEHTDNAVRMRATELLADLLGKRKAELLLHHDIIEIKPAPRPEELATDQPGIFPTDDH